MDENYMALVVAILSPETITIEQAFERLARGKLKREVRSNKYGTAALEDDEMMRMRDDGNSYREIGEIYGMRAQAVYRRIFRRREKLNAITG